LRRVASVLYWTVVVVLGAFGVYFTVANYPFFATAVALVILLLIGFSEWKRRARQNARDEARRRDQARMR
jgi:hypothetical protein